jgi:hypothetical protein
MIELNKITLILFLKYNGLGSMHAYCGFKRKEKFPQMLIFQCGSNYFYPLASLEAVGKFIDTPIFAALYVIYLYSLAIFKFYFVFGLLQFL